MIKIVPASSSIDHVLPDNHTQTIAMIIPSCRLNLDMLPNHVEAKLFSDFNIIDESFIGRCGIQAVRPISLIKNTVLK
ncbi:hypothetical protein D3C81_1348010 [compost metagenome]